MGDTAPLVPPKTKKGVASPHPMWRAEAACQCCCLAVGLLQMCKATADHLGVTLF